MLKKRSPLLAFAGLMTCLLMMSSRGAQAQDYYQGKTISIIVGVDAGSGYDAYGRLLGRYLSRHVPGGPNVIVQNMPGAASIKAAEYIYSIAPKDGTQFAVIFPNALVDPLTGDLAKFRYDPTKFDHLGTADVGTRLCYTIGSSKIRTLEDARTTKVVLGSTARSSPASDYAQMTNAVAGTKFEVVTGYKGPADIFLAMERGEVEGMCGIDVSTVMALRPEWLGSTKAHFLVQAGLEENPKMTALGIPSLWKYTAPELRKGVELVVSQQVFQRPYIAPPGTPAGPLAMLRKAFVDAHKDPALLEEAQKMNLSINVKGGEEVSALVKQMYASPKALIEQMTRLIRG